jgi:hypothetical protein
MEIISTLNNGCVDIIQSLKRMDAAKDGRSVK